MANHMYFLNISFFNQSNHKWTQDMPSFYYIKYKFVFSVYYSVSINNKIVNNIVNNFIMFISN